MRVLITGIGGFCGGFLVDHLRRQGLEVFGIERSALAGGNTPAGNSVFRGDVRDGAFVHSVVQRVRPDRIYHLAAVTAEPDGGLALQELYETNLHGTLNVLEAASGLKNDEIVVLVSSSGIIYDAHPPSDGLPLTESSATYPLTHYGLSKLLQDAVGSIYSRTNSLRVVTARCFNVVGPGQAPQSVCSNLARQVAEAERRSAPTVIAVGNLDSRRDYVDVRDVVRAFWLLTERGQPGQAYNVCTGQDRSVREILDILLRHSHLDRSRTQVAPEASRMRPDEAPVRYGDYSKLKAATGWAPELPFEQTLKDVLDYWRTRVRGSSGREPAPAALAGAR